MLYKLLYNYLYREIQDLEHLNYLCLYDTVAPHAGAWIEILKPKFTLFEPYVAPHAGAWIEIIYELC